MAPNILSLDAISKQYAEHPLLRDVSLGIGAGERVGVVGVNGSGKTTLLRIAAGVEQPDAGRVSRARDTRVAYLPQNPALAPDLSVLEQLFSDETPALKLVRDYAAAADAVAHTHDAAAQQRLAALTDAMDAQGAWDLERQARAILSRLGITDLGARVGDLSGGQRRRVAMAATLINPAELLILDEPTNHIDTDTIAWLEAFLARSTAALLLVTHDRYFLDRVCQRIVEVDTAALYSYPGAYSRFLELKAERQATLAADEGRRQTLLRKELAWLRRGAQARTTKQQARVDRAEALQADRPAEQQGTVEIGSLARRLGKKVIELQGVRKGFGERRLIDNLTLSVGAGERIAIIGPNGSGKTSLLNMIAGRTSPDAGSVVVGETVHLAYYDQEAAGLDEQQRAIDYVQEGAERIETGDGKSITAAQLLERFLFKSSAHYTPIGRLSGGERRRLYLLRKLMDAPNVLLLDEPTNDLDIQTLNVLEDYLDTFAGSVIIVSHDRYFIDRVAERTLAFEDGTIRAYPGGYSAYAEQAAQRPLPGPEKGKGSEVRQRPLSASERGKGGEVVPSTPTPRRLSGPEQRELRDLEGKLAKLETEQTRINSALVAGGDYQRIAGLSAELAASTAAIDVAFARWAALAEIAEATKR